MAVLQRRMKSCHNTRTAGEILQNETHCRNLRRHLVFSSGYETQCIQKSTFSNRYLLIFFFFFFESDCISTGPHYKYQPDNLIFRYRNGARKWQTCIMWGSQTTCLWASTNKHDFSTLAYLVLNGSQLNHPSGPLHGLSTRYKAKQSWSWSVAGWEPKYVTWKSMEKRQ